MSCDQFTDLLELYAAGALERADYESLRTHLESGCADCGLYLDEALLQAAFISSSVPMVEPPASLRGRIAASVNAATQVVVMPQKKRFSSLVPWLVAAACLATMAGAISYEQNMRRNELAAMSASLSASDSEAQRMAQMLSILQAPGTKQVAFNVTQAQLPHGSFFIHAKLGVAMVVSHLPAAPQGWKYESWVVPKAGAPRPVESFGINKSGVGVTVVQGPVDVSQWAALAVSLEPVEANPVKPTKVVFASPV